MNTRVFNIGATIAFTLFVILIWQLAVDSGLVNRLFLATPVAGLRRRCSSVRNPARCGPRSSTPRSA